MTLLYSKFTIKVRFLYANTECNLWNLILFTIIFQKSFSNKDIVAMNLHQTLEIEVPKSVLSVCVFWFKDILWTNYIHIIFTNYSKVIWSDEKSCHDWWSSSILLYNLNTSFLVFLKKNPHKYWIWKASFLHEPKKYVH